MRFISKISALRIEAIGQKWDTLANGQVRELAPSTWAEFRQEPLFPWEERAARAGFVFTGYVEEDHVSEIKVDPITRCSVFDSDIAAERYGWTPEQKKQVEENMLKASQTNPDFMFIPKPALEKPWPSYDETHHSKVASMVEEFGLDKNEVLAYERETKNRPSVIEALENIEDPTIVPA